MGSFDIGSSEIKSEHSITAKNRSLVTVCGVSDVPEFDENTVVLTTSAGNMVLEGKGLRIKVLDTRGGVVEVEGTLNGVLYYDKPSESDKKGKIGRWFK